MATATKKARPTRKPTPIEFRVFEDNGGGYQWTIVTARGEELAESVSFATQALAEKAAGRIRDGAATARFEPLTPAKRGSTR